jgi:hypothetical protein
VVGNARKVQRSIDLDVVAERVLDALALEILVGITWVGDTIAEGPGVKRITGVDVGFAEISFAQRIALRQRL